MTPAGAGSGLGAGAGLGAGLGAAAVLGAGPRVLALGGGHGLAASLQALRLVTDRLTAVVTVADDGGSSGRLRTELGAMPPGDLRMALAALAADDERGRTWARLLQHRFGGTGPLAGHAVGNLLLAGLAETLATGGDPADRDPAGGESGVVAALDALTAMLGGAGRVLPMSCQPLEIRARVRGHDPDRPNEVSDVRGQVAVASSPGEVVELQLWPSAPEACPEAVEAVLAADWVVLGPGSWFTSVLTHLLVPGLRAALEQTPARLLVALNLAEQPGETDGFSPERHVEVLRAHAPGLRPDVLLADPARVLDTRALMSAAQECGARLVLAPVAVDDGNPRHDPARLARAYAQIFSGPAGPAPTGGPARTALTPTALTPTGPTPTGPTLTGPTLRGAPWR